MPAPVLNVKIFEGNSIKVLENQINSFLAQFSNAEIKTASITVDEKIFYIIVVFLVG